MYRASINMLIGKLIHLIADMSDLRCCGLTILLLAPTMEATIILSRKLSSSVIVSKVGKDFHLFPTPARIKQILAFSILP